MNTSYELDCSWGKNPYNPNDHKYSKFPNGYPKGCFKYTNPSEVEYYYSSTGTSNGRCNPNDNINRHRMKTKIMDMNL